MGTLTADLCIVCWRVFCCFPPWFGWCPRIISLGAKNLAAKSSAMFWRLQGGHPNSNPSRLSRCVGDSRVGRGPLAKQISCSLADIRGRRVLFMITGLSVVLDLRKDSQSPRIQVNADYMALVSLKAVLGQQLTPPSTMFQAHGRAQTTCIGS